MRYGLESETKAILKYEDQTKRDVCASGSTPSIFLWGTLLMALLVMMF